jgi:hypothetical protein
MHKSARCVRHRADHIPWVEKKKAKPFALSLRHIAFVKLARFGD